MFNVLQDNCLYVVNLEQEDLDEGDKDCYGDVCDNCFSVFNFD